VSFPVVGMVGAGQLARMCAQAAIGLGVKFTILAADAQESAAQVVPAKVIGNHDNVDDLLAFARGCDVITFDHEHVPTEHLDALIAAGIAVRPGPHALVNAQDKLQMRTTLSAAGIPAPSWREVITAEDVAEFAATAGWPVVLKTARGGYDGKGVMVVSSAEEAAVVLSGSSVRWLVEEKVDFICELAVQVARSPHGQAAVYPVVQTIQRDGICREVIAPAPINEDTAMQAQSVALQIAQLLDVTGMLAVEMFLTANGVVVNELAMRPHNSGHWTIDGAVTSQFEQHLRAVLDLPLGSTAALAPHVVMVNVLGGDHPDMYHAYLHCMARDPGLKIHMYGKEVRPGRKVGHVTVVGDDLEDLLERGRHAAAYLTGEITE
jgi:5-(carboxyamino)imidazole ribonucleotide synthase